MRKKNFILTALVVCVCTFLFMVSQSRAATEAQIEAAIESGLAWLAARQDTTNGSWNDQWGNGVVGYTGLAVLKFEDYARELDPNMSPFDPNYVYHQNVIDGLDYIFSQAQIIDISVQPAGDPDTRVNGKGVCWYNSTYHTSIAMMAIAGSEAPGRVVSGGACNTWTYKAVLQDAVDYLAYGQTDINDLWGNNCGDRGGWSYSARNWGCGNDNSNAGYAVLGLGYAQTDPFNCTVPLWVMSELSLYCDYIQNDVDGDTDDGGSGYADPNSWVNILKTGNLLYEMALTGDTETTIRVTDALDYLDRHWGDNADPGWRPNHYQAMYTCMKGLEAMGIFTFGAAPEIDWYEDFSDAIVSQQDPNGNWSGCPCYCYGDITDPGPPCHMGDDIICTAWALLTLERSVPPLIRPVVGDIPDQCVLIGDSFVTINLDDYVEDGDNDDSEISWTAAGGVNISVSIDASRVATITYPANWTGSETITFTATDPDNQSDSDEAAFTVDPVPVVSGIPDQTAPFVTFDLDGYLSGIDPLLVTWSYSGNSCLQVSIDSDNVVTITNPGGTCQDPEDITFTATAIACGQGVTDSDTATFIPNQPPDCTEAEADNDCLWPPNHKFVDVGIVGVTDPDGDPITITITGITSDEPTATAKGAGGAKHAPDAAGVGTDTASLRAERSGSGLGKGKSGAGPGNGRVYEISFTASDGRGGECEGTVQVKVPHDRRKHTCIAIDDGQIYDATQVN